MTAQPDRREVTLAAARSAILRIGSLRADIVEVGLLLRAGTIEPEAAVSELFRIGAGPYLNPDLVGLA